MTRGLLALIQVLLGVQGASGQTGPPMDIRESLPAPPAALYPELFRLAEQQDWIPLGKGVEIIASLLDDVDRHSPDAPGTELRVAVAREDSRSVVQLLGVVVVEGAISLLADATAAGGPAERRERIRTAFAEVLTLEPRVRSERYHLWNEIERGFRTAHHLSSTRGEAFPDACHVLSILLRSAVADGDGGR